MATAGSPGRFAAAIALAATACGAPAADRDETEAVQAAISRVDDKLTAMNERLAQIEARADQAADAAKVTTAPSGSDPAIGQAIAVAAERASAESKPGSRVEIVVTDAGITVDGTPQTIAELEQSLTAAVDKYDVTVEIQADESVSQTRLVELITCTQDAGVERMALAKRVAP